MKHGRRRGNVLRRWEWLRRWCSEVWAQLWVGICGTTLGNLRESDAPGGFELPTFWFVTLAARTINN